jgi:hypothetical protein
MHLKSYKIVSDDIKKPMLIKHSKICYSPLNPECIDEVDASYPGIVIDFGNDNYLLEYGLHRIAKLQKSGIYESLFYVVTVEEYKNGIVDMIFGECKITLGEWNNTALELKPHI